MTGRFAKTGFQENMVLWRLNVDGSLDKTFNRTGWVTHNGAAGAKTDTDWGLAVLPDATGRILVTGLSDNRDFDHDMAIWRFEAN